MTRRVAGSRRRRARPPHRGVLAVSPERRGTGVLVGLTLLAVVTGTTTVAFGVARLLDGPADTEVRYGGSYAPLDVAAPTASVEGTCAGRTATGTWAWPSGAEALRVAVLSDDGVPLGSAAVADDGTWTVPLRAVPQSTSAVVLLERGTGAVATGSC